MSIYDQYTEAIVKRMKFKRIVSKFKLPFIIVASSIIVLVTSLLITKGIVTSPISFESEYTYGDEIVVETPNVFNGSVIKYKYKNLDTGEEFDNCPTTPGNYSVKVITTGAFGSERESQEYNFTINKRNATVAIPSDSLTYGENPVYTIDLLEGETVENLDFIVDLTAESIANLKATIRLNRNTLVIRDKNGNNVTQMYNIIFEDKEVDLVKTNIVLDPQVFSKDYDGTLYTYNKELKNTVTYYDLDFDYVFLDESKTNVVTPMDAGDYYVSIKKSSIKIMDGDLDVTNLFSIDVVDERFSIKKRDIIIQTDSIEKTYDGVKIESNASSYALVQGSTLISGDTIALHNKASIINVGTTKNNLTVDIIKSDGSINYNYNITYIYGTYTINKRNVTIKPLPISSKPYDGEEVTYSNEYGNFEFVDGTSFVEEKENAIINVKFIKDGEPSTALGIGTYKAVISSVGGNSILDINNYNFTFQEETFGIGIISVELKIDALTDKQYDGLPFDTSTISYTVVSGELAPGEVVTISASLYDQSGNKTTSANVGKYYLGFDSIKINGKEVTNYDITVNNSDYFEIKKRVVTVKPFMEETSKTYNSVGTIYSALSNNFAYANDSLKIVDGEKLTIGVKILDQDSNLCSSMLNAGTYTISVNANDYSIENGSLDNYDIRIDSSITYTINKREISISPNKELVSGETYYDGTTRTYSNVPGNFISSYEYDFESEGIIANVVFDSTPKNVGTYTLSIESVSDSKNFTFDYSSIETFTISKRDLEITLNNLETKEYNNEATSYPYVDNNYNVSLSDALIDGEILKVKVGFVDSLNNKLDQVTAAGTYTLYLKEYSVAGGLLTNYNLTVKNLEDTFTISKRESTVTLKNKSYTYTGSEINYGGTDTYEATNLINDSDLVIVSYTQEEAINVGEYAVSVNEETAVMNSNYKFTFVSASITITPIELKINLLPIADLTYNGSERSDAYSSEASNFTYYTGSSELLTGHTMTITVKYNKTPKDAGTYVVSFDSFSIAGTNASNYSVTAMNTTELTIKQKEIRVSLYNRIDVEYDGLEHKDYPAEIGNYDSIDALYNGDTLEIQVSYTGDFTNVGGTNSYKLLSGTFKDSSGNVSNNYFASSDDEKTVTITKRTVTICPIEVEAAYTGSQYSYNSMKFAYATGSKEFCGEDKVYNVSVAFTQSSSPASPIEVGTYDMTITSCTFDGSSANNYNIVYDTVSSELEIKEFGLTVTLSSVTNSFIYDSIGHSGLEEYTTTGLCSGHTVNVSVSYKNKDNSAITSSITNVNTNGYEIILTATILDSGSNDVTSNYAITYEVSTGVTNLIEVTPCTITLVVNPAERTYTKVSQPLTGSEYTVKSVSSSFSDVASLGLAITGATYKVEGVETHPIDAQTYSVTDITTNNTDPNFNVVVEDGTLTISKKQVEVELKPISNETYNGLEHKPYTVEEGNINNSVTLCLTDTITIKVKYTGDLVNVGTVKYEYDSFLINGLINNNYEVTCNASKTFEIEKKDLQIVLKNIEDHTYDGTQYGTYDGTVDSLTTGLVDGEYLTIEVEFAEATRIDTGTYTYSYKLSSAVITGSNDKISNYNVLTVEDKTFEILKKDVEVKPATFSKVYDATDSFSYDHSTSIITGLVGTDSITTSEISVSGDHTIVGKYNTQITSYAFTSGKSSNYNVSTPAVENGFEIEKRTVNVKLVDPFEHHISYDGLSHGYTANTFEYSTGTPYEFCENHQFRLVTKFINNDTSEELDYIKNYVENGYTLYMYSWTVVDASLNAYSENYDVVCEEVEDAFFIDKLNVSIHAYSDLTHVYSGTNYSYPDLNNSSVVNCVSTGFVTGEGINITDVSYKVGDVKVKYAKHVGTYQVIIDEYQFITGTLGTNYNVTVTNEGSLTITPYTIVIELNNISNIVYDGAEHDDAFDLSSKGYIEPSTISPFGSDSLKITSVVYSTSSSIATTCIPKNVGTYYYAIGSYQINDTTAYNDDYNIELSSIKSFDITKKQLMFACYPIASHTYDGKAFTPYTVGTIYELGFIGLCDNDKIKGQYQYYDSALLTNVVSPIHVGTYYCSVLPDSVTLETTNDSSLDNYSYTVEGAVSFTITQREVHVEPISYNITYDGKHHTYLGESSGEFVYSASTPNKFVSGDTFTITSVEETESFIDAGTYQVTIINYDLDSTVSLDSDYLLMISIVDFKINKKEIRVNFNKSLYEYDYDGEEKVVTLDYTYVSGYAPISGETININYTYSGTLINPGTYTGSYLSSSVSGGQASINNYLIKNSTGESTPDDIEVKINKLTLKLVINDPIESSHEFDNESYNPLTGSIFGTATGLASFHELDTIAVAYKNVTKNSSVSSMVYAGSYEYSVDFETLELVSGGFVKDYYELDSTSILTKSFEITPKTINYNLNSLAGKQYNGQVYNYGLETLYTLNTSDSTFLDNASHVFNLTLKIEDEDGNEAIPKNAGTYTYSVKSASVSSLINPLSKDDINNSYNLVCSDELTFSITKVAVRIDPLSGSAEYRAEGYDSDDFLENKISGMNYIISAIVYDTFDVEITSVLFDGSSSVSIPGTYTVTIENKSYDSSLDTNYDITFGTSTFTINKKVVSIPDSVEKQYTSELINSDIASTTEYTVSGDLTGTSIGSYTVFYELTDSSIYEWDFSILSGYTKISETKISKDWSIIKRDLTIITEYYLREYNGNPITVNELFDQEKITVEGYLGEFTPSQVNLDISTAADRVNWTGNVESYSLTYNDSLNDIYNVTFAGSSTYQILKRKAVVSPISTNYPNGTYSTSLSYPSYPMTATNYVSDDIVSGEDFIFSVIFINDTYGISNSSPSNKIGKERISFNGVESSIGTSLASNYEFSYVDYSYEVHLSEITINVVESTEYNSYYQEIDDFATVTSTVSGLVIDNLKVKTTSGSLDKVVHAGKYSIDYKDICIYDGSALIYGGSNKYIDSIVTPVTEWTITKVTLKMKPVQEFMSAAYDGNVHTISNIFEYTEGSLVGVDENKTTLKAKSGTFGQPGVVNAGTYDVVVNALNIYNKTTGQNVAELDYDLTCDTTGIKYTVSKANLSITLPASDYYTLVDATGCVVNGLFSKDTITAMVVVGDPNYQTIDEMLLYMEIRNTYVGQALQNYNITITIGG